VKRHLALVGFMAAGKSTIGRKLARRLECDFVDTDEVIVREHGAIQEIFALEGEAAFRRYEREAIEQVLAGAPPCVAALGGGAMTIPENRAMLKSRAYTIFLRVSAERIAQRVRHSPQARPALGARPSLSRIRALYRERMPQYADADHVIEAERLNDRQIVDAIVLWLNERA
jgi:shikimate kinase